MAMQFFINGKLASKEDVDEHYRKLTKLPPDDEIMLMDSQFPATRKITADEAVQYIVSEKWQPIETAPKDGSEVFLFSDGLYIGVWSEYVSNLRAGNGWVDRLDVFTELRPTHWMPLDWIPHPK